MQIDNQQFLYLPSLGGESKIWNTEFSIAGDVLAMFLYVLPYLAEVPIH